MDSEEQNQIIDMDEYKKNLAKAIRESAVQRGTCLGNYMVDSLTIGCWKKVKANDYENRENGIYDPLTFLVRDAFYFLPEGGVDCRVLKYANPEVLIKKPRLNKLIEREWQVISKLGHPNIVKCFPLVRKGKINYLPLEYLPKNVFDVIGAKPDLEGIYFFAFQAAQALRYLNSQGVVYGDINIQQFMAANDPECDGFSVIKLMDFTNSLHPDVFTSSIISYTPGYVAPELNKAIEDETVFEAQEKFLTPKADIYSLGVTLAKVALTSKMDHSEISDIFDGTEKCAQRSIEAMYDHYFPTYFNGIVELMTDKDPNERIGIEEVIVKLNTFRFAFNLAPKVVDIKKDLYSGAETKVIERAY